MLTQFSRTGERDMTDKREKRKRGHDKNKSPAPRTRDGKAFPGGRHLRRALAKLSARQNATLKDGRKPGSMK
jgi:hypothetical protein